MQLQKQHNLFGADIYIKKPVPWCRLSFIFIFEFCVSIKLLLSMTEEQMILVRNSWRTFRNVKPALIANVFYSKLFFDNPKLRKMFPENMEKQYLKLVDMLTVMISHIDNPDDI